MKNKHIVFPYVAGISVELQRLFWGFFKHKMTVFSSAETVPSLSGGPRWQTLVKRCTHVQ